MASPSTKYGEEALGSKVKKNLRQETKAWTKPAQSDFNGSEEFAKRK